MGDDDEPALARREEALESLEPVEVEIVRRLVEKQHVERESRIAASATRAASPPESAVVGRSSETGSPSSAATVPARVLEVAAAERTKRSSAAA